MQRLAILIIAAVLFGAPLAPAAAQVAQPIQTVELSTDMVNRFIASMPALKAVMNKYDGQIPKRRAATGNSPLAAFQGYAAYRRIKAEMSAAVGGYGFSSYEDWMAVAQTTILSFVYLKSSDVRAQVRPAMERALRSLEANKSMTEAQKAQVRKNLTRSMTAAFGGPPPSENNLSIVRTMGPQIQNAMRTLSRRN